MKNFNLCGIVFWMALATMILEAAGMHSKSLLGMSYILAVNGLIACVLARTREKCLLRG